MTHINVMANLILVNTRNLSGSNQTGDSGAKKNDGVRSNAVAVLSGLKRKLMVFYPFLWP